MMGYLESKIDFIVAVHIVLKVLFQGSIFDFGLYEQVVPVALDADIIIIVAVDEGGIGKQAAVEDMVPASGRGAVSVIDTELTADTEYIFSKITGKVYAIILIESIIGFQIQIIEIQTVFVDGRIAGEFEKYIRIGSSATHDKRTFVFYDRAFHREA